MASEPEKIEPEIPGLKDITIMKKGSCFNKHIILNLMIMLDMVTPLDLHMGFCRLGYPIGLAYSRVYDTSPFAC